MPKPPLVSVIVPVYEVEQFIPRCLDSILNQTYRDIEVVVVNDGSTGNINDIVAGYQKKNSNVKLLDMGENKGLFRARLEGLKAAAGDYVMTVDGDDSISSDYVRTLVTQAEHHKSDIVIAETVLENENEKYIYNLANDLPFESLSGDECLEKFFEQQGENYTWHTVHSKIYSRRVLDSAIPYLDTVRGHIVMCEDVLFSVAFWSFAKRVDRSPGAYYFYYSNQNSTTRIVNPSTTKKKIDDINTVFGKVGEFVAEKKLTDKFGKDLLEWMNLYSFMYHDLIEGLSYDTKTKKELTELIKFGDEQWSKKTASHFYKVRTLFNDGLEKLKNQIIDEKIECISFDIFDTLVMRPFFRPSDLFYLLNDDFKKLDKQFRLEDFHSIRMKSEETARLQKSDKEDVSLKQIYEVMQKDYLVSKAVAQKMLQKELGYEVRYCVQRKTTKEIYDLAVYLNKRIIITSDMYLPQSDIEKILHNCGYQGYYKLYVSSHIGTMKATQNLYNHITKELSMLPKSVLHIGDNYETDVVAAKKVGWGAAHYPKATELHDQFGKVFEESSHYASSHQGIAIGYATAMNRYFDNPFRSFNQNSNYNCSPYFMGYFSLGLAMLDFTKWMVGDLEDKDVKSVVFLSRDGYLPMKVFNIFKERFGLQIKSHYLPTSRKATIPLSIFGAVNAAEVKSFNYKGQMNDSILASLGSVFRDGADKKVENIDYDKTRQLQAAFVNTYKDFFRSRTAIMDIGYSGKPEYIFAELFDVPIQTYFMYTGDDNAKRRLGGSVKIYSRLDMAIIREKIISEIGPSCTGYKLNGSKVEPVFGTNATQYYEKYIISEIQRGAIDFINEFLELFYDCFTSLEFGENAFAMQALDRLVKLPAQVDRELFRGLLHEDEIAGDESIDIFDMHYNYVQKIESENASLNAENYELKKELAGFMGIKRSAKLLAGNIKRRARRDTGRG